MSPCVPAPAYQLSAAPMTTRNACGSPPWNSRYNWTAPGLPNSIAPGLPNSTTPGLPFHRRDNRERLTSPVMRSILFAVPILLTAASTATSAPTPKPLAIVKAMVRQFEDGPPPGTDFNYFTGDTVFFSFEVQGYKVSEDSRLDLRVTIDAVDSEGTPLADTVKRKIDTQLSAEDKDWMPIVRETIQIPPLALPGKFHIKTTVEDALARQTVTSDTPFGVRGKKVEPSPTLVVRNFHFYRGEEERNPLEAPVYHPGDALWTRFDVIGFRYAEKNRMQVEYGVAILDPAGNTVFSQPEAAVEKDASFYPKRYVPGAFSINLDKNVKPGEYTLVLSLRDTVGDQAFESRHPFRVE